MARQKKESIGRKATLFRPGTNFECKPKLEVQDGVSLESQHDAVSSPHHPQSPLQEDQLQETSSGR